MRLHFTLHADAPALRVWGIVPVLKKPGPVIADKADVLR